MLACYWQYVRSYGVLGIIICGSIAPLSARMLLMIEGNGGAGKTTLSHLIERELNALIIKEPVDRWQQVGNTGNLLDLYYNHRERWGFTMLNYTCFTVMQECLEADQSKELYVCDRSIYSGFYCFAKMMQEHDYVTPLELYIYQEQFAWLEAILPCRPDGFIYLRTTQDCCLERMRARGRPEEATVTLDFLETLHHYHEQWLIEKLQVAPAIMHVPILVLDGNLDFKNDPAIQRVFIEQIRVFIEEVKVLKYNAHSFLEWALCTVYK